MDETARPHNRVALFLVGVLALFLVSSVLNFSFVEKANCFQPITQPIEGDYLRYNLTLYGTQGDVYYTTFNFTFAVLPFNITIGEEVFEFNSTAFPNLVKASIEVSNWTLFTIPAEPKDEVCMGINTTDRSFFGTYPFNGSIYHQYFQWMIPTDVYEGAEIPFTEGSGRVIGTEELLLNGVQYLVWVVNRSIFMSQSSICKFDMLSGILLWESMMNTGSQEVVLTWALLEAKIGDTVIIQEFPSLLVLPLLVMAKLLTGIVFKRKIAHFK